MILLTNHFMSHDICTVLYTLMKIEIGEEMRLGRINGNLPAVLDILIFCRSV